METGVSATDAARLEVKGYTPEMVSARISEAPVRYDDERDAEAAIDVMLYGADVRHRVTTLAHGQPEYTALLDLVRSDAALVARMWSDAESRLDELDVPGTRWSVVLVDGVPAAWCAARVEGGMLKAFCNYEVPAYRGHGFYAAAYRERHTIAVGPSNLPAVTYLFRQPLAVHEADGWYRTGVSGVSTAAGEPHEWWELRRDPTG